MSDLPQGAGWVAYHDVASLPGPQGIAMTWRVPGKGLRWAAAIDRAHEGCVHAAGWLGEDQDLHEVIGNAVRGDRSLRPVTEGQAFGLLFPHEGNRPPPLGFDGLPPLEEHAALARRAVHAADIPPAMRKAFTACLDHGAPHDLPLVRLRRKTGSREWAALELAARHSLLAQSVNEAGPMLLTGDDPLARIRRRWPGMTDAHLRRLGESDSSKGLVSTQSSRGRGVTMLPLLLSIPIDWWPKKRDWRSFEACSASIGAISRSAFVKIPYETLVSSCGGDWTGFAGRLARASGLTGEVIQPHDLADRGADCRDPLGALVRDVLVPLFASREDEDGRVRLEYAYGQTIPRDAPDTDRHPLILAAQRAAQHVLYQGKSAPGILEASRRWHGRQATMQAEIRGRDGGARWPSLFEDEYRDGDVGIVAVSDYATLREEGGFGPDRNGVGGLDHCVASRLPECLSGQAHVLSVRMHSPDGTWRRLSTCQVSVQGSASGRHQLSIGEHRGKGNAAPCAGAMSAVLGLSEAIREGRVRVLPGALDPMPQLGGSIATKCGYDWRYEAELARALQAWEPLLPRWARGIGPSGFYDALAELGFAPIKDPHGPSPGMG
jgi:hypothetical protein